MTRRPDTQVICPRPVAGTGVLIALDLGVVEGRGWWRLSIDGRPMGRAIPDDGEGGIRGWKGSQTADDVAARWLLCDAGGTYARVTLWDGGGPQDDAALTGRHWLEGDETASPFYCATASGCAGHLAMWLDATWCE